MPPGLAHDVVIHPRFLTISTGAVLAAVGAGILHALLAPLIAIGGLHPNLALVGVALVASLAGAESGLVWAFASGLAANVILREPLGSLPLLLVGVAALAAAMSRLWSRGAGFGVPLLAAALGSLVVDLGGIGIHAGLGDPLPAVSLDLLLRVALLNTAVTALLLLPARRIADRLRPEQQPPAW